MENTTRKGRDESLFCGNEDLALYICAICCGVFENPSDTPCRHTFCTDCITSWLDKSKSCPLCKSNLDKNNLLPISYVLKNILERLEVYCDNKHKGCTSTFKWSQLIYHRNEVCLFEQVRCSFSLCKEKFMKKDRILHESECKYRPQACKFCNINLRALDFPAHDFQCEKFPIECLRCKEISTREESEFHKSVCPEMEVPCSFSKYGCEFVTKRKFMKEHTTGAISEHLLLLTMQVDKQQMFIEQLSTFKFNFKNLLKDLQGGNYVSSPEFNFPSNWYTWRVRFRRSENFIGFFVNLVTTGCSVEGTFKLRILGDGKEIINSSVGPKIFTVPKDSGWGRSKLLEMEKIKDIEDMQVELTVLSVNTKQ